MKITTRLQTVLLVFTMALLSPTLANASNDTIPAPTKTQMDKINADKMIERLEEIKSLDKSNLTRVEKKELREEVKGIKKGLKANGNGVYLSVGAILIIILLLILLL
jgi:hypothetical protein